MPTGNYCFHTELNSLLSIGGFFRFSRAGWPTCCSLDYVYSIAEILIFVNTFEEEIFGKMENLLGGGHLILMEGFTQTSHRFYISLHIHSYQAQM